MNFLSKLTAGITPYTAGEQLNDKSYVKLNTNENPYPPSPRVAEAVALFNTDTLKLYPQPNADILREKIAEVEGVKPENVFCGNGSDEVLALCFPAFFDRDGLGAAFADITYSFYPVFADFFSIPKKIVPLKADYTMDLSALKATECQGYFITNPNAPTGIGIEREVMRKFILSVPNKLVIADEAYMGFMNESCAPLVNECKNLLVVKTFSKYYSLAGIRCGYAVGDKDIINGLFRAKDCFNSYPIDRLCACVCAAAIGDKAYYSECAKKVCSERERVRDSLISMGFFVPKSSSNFLFASLEGVDGKYIYKGLKEEGVLVRHWDSEKLKNFCRITIGDKNQNDILLQKLKKILNK